MPYYVKTLKFSDHGGFIIWSELASSWQDALSRVAGNLANTAVCVELTVHLSQDAILSYTFNRDLRRYFNGVSFTDYAGDTRGIDFQSGRAKVVVSDGVYYIIYKQGASAQETIPITGDDVLRFFMSQHGTPYNCSDFMAVHGSYIAAEDYHTISTSLSSLRQEKADKSTVESIDERLTNKVNELEETVTKTAGTAGSYFTSF